MSTTKPVEDRLVDSAEQMTEDTSAQGISDRVSQLSSAKRALLQRLLLEKSAGRTRPTIPRHADRSIAPLSFAQQRLWFLEQLEPGSAHYNMPIALRLRGLLNLSALSSALNEVVRRHEILRTHFAVTDGEPRQIISPPGLVQVAVLELSDLPAAALERESQIVAAESRQPFDLLQGPLLRVKLLRLGAAEHVLLLTMHHIISDGWSMGVLVREVSALYAAAARQQPSPLGELPIQYADYASWQRQHLQGEVLEQQLAYWREQLADAPPVLELPTDKPRPAVQNYRGGAVESFRLSRELTTKLKQLSSERSVTLFMTLLAAFQTLLYRYSNQSDILVGTPIANRTRAETENLIGLFVNTLVLRSRFSAQLSFSELLQQVREVTLGAYAHQDVPFEKVVEELQPERSLSRTPLFQVMFEMQNAPMPAAELSGLQMSPVGEPGERTAKFELSLAMMETEDGLTGAFDYRAELFAPETVKRTIGHFEQVLRAIVADAEQPVAGIDLLSAAERRQLLQEWKAVEYPADKCLHELFEAQVARIPDSVAAVFEEQQLTYRQLNSRANQLAHHLRGLGVGPEVVVGLLLPRSLDLVTSVLAVLKAGGAYLPLDPAYPPERLSFMLDDAEAKILLTSEELAERVSGCRATTFLVDDGETIAHESNENPEINNVTDNLAYLIYTSGSTGKPKGVQVTHRNVARLFAGTDALFQFNQEDVWTLFHSAAFDFSVWEIWGALLYGGRLVVVPYWVSRAPEEFVELLRREGVTVVNQTPSAFRQLARAATANGKVELCLRFVIFGGEALELWSLKPWFEVYGDRSPRLVNMYGITETTVHVSFRSLALSDVEQNARSVIGRPLNDLQVYLLDQFQQLVPIGVPGEIYVGGGGLSRGYLKRFDLTAERFVPDAFSATPGARLYRTGDIARRVPAGGLEFLGRVDEQVKVRGFRIEPGEIEAVLRQHESVREAVVNLIESEPGEKRLVAYLLATDGQQPTSGDLRRYLEEQLPSHMIPATFVWLDELPLTAGGKVNRRALLPPPPPPSASESEEAFLVPQTQVGQLLAGIWQAVLRVERVGVEDNFFELGGHSLLATQLVSRIRESFGVELPVRNLFEHPTVGELAPVVEQALVGGPALSAMPVAPVPRDQPLPLSFAQQRLWFFEQLKPNTATYNMPAAVEQTGPLHLEALEQTLTEIFRRHEILRTTFSVNEGQAAQIVGAAVPVRLPVIDLSELSERDRELTSKRLVHEEAQRPFDLARGPLLRLTLLRLGPQRHIVLITMHHIVSDGWSTGVLIREIAALYEAYSTGNPSPLSELKVQYADYAVWQRQWLQGAVFETHLTYWKRQLTGAPPVLQLPTDRPRPAVLSYQGAQENFVLSAELAEQLKALSRREGVTLFMTLLAAFQTLLYRYAGHDRMVVGSPIAGRNRAETEPLIGFFINTLVMCTDFSGSPSFVELLARVRDVALGAYAHQEMPFDKLVEELAPERGLGTAPLVQVMFVLQNIPNAPVKLTGLNLRQVEIQSEAARFDLHLGMSETPAGLFATFTYATDLFDATTIRRMCENLEMLLRQVADVPESSIDSLVQLLTEADRERSIAAEREFKESSSRQLRNIKRRVAAKPSSERGE